MCNQAGNRGKSSKTQKQKLRRTGWEKSTIVAAEGSDERRLSNKTPRDVFRVKYSDVARRRQQHPNACTSQTRTCAGIAACNVRLLILNGIVF